MSSAVLVVALLAVSGETQPPLRPVTLGALELDAAPMARLRTMAVRPSRTHDPAKARLSLLDDIELQVAPPVDPLALVIVPASASVEWPAGPHMDTPRARAEVGVTGSTVAFGMFTLYAHGAAEVSADAAKDDDGRQVQMSGLGRFGVHARATETIDLALELSRRGPASFDLVGDEARTIASLRWRFGW
jgi:hypothetical protein